MAIYHLSATPIQRSKGHSAIAAAAYRAGEKLHDRQLDQQHDYSRKRGIVQSEILAPDNAPEWARNREELWNRAEAAEKRKDAQPAREIRLALPDELTDGQRADLVFHYCRDAFVSRGMIADISIHRPDRHGDQRNHHAHILLTMRELDGDQFAARKNRDWNKEEVLREWREQWAECQNRALEQAGHAARVDHRTLEAQGIDRTPTTHLGKEATAMERRGERSERGDKNRQVTAKNQTIDGIKAELAEVDEEIRNVTSEQKQPATWEERKAAAQSALDSTLNAAFEQEIAEKGEVKEYGLGKHWYDRTVAMFSLMYRSAIDAAKDLWRRYSPSRNMVSPNLDFDR